MEISSASLLLLLVVSCLLVTTPLEAKPAPTLRPSGTHPARISCDYDPQALHAHKIPQPQQQQWQENLKIGIIVLYAKNVAGAWGAGVMKKALYNRHSYARHHGYDVVNVNHLIDHTRPVAWSKFLGILHYLHQYDYLMYIDMDAVIMQPSITIQSLIYATEQSASADLIMQSDWNGPNTGIFLAKNTTWTRDFLQLAWNQKQLLKKKKVHLGALRTHPFEYEQRAFHFLLGTEQWRRESLPLFDPNRTQGFLKHITFLPQCAMNSYTLLPKGQDRWKSEYIPGDFIIHFAGHRGEHKMSLLRKFLSEAESRFKEQGVMLAHSTKSSDVKMKPGHGQGGSPSSSARENKISGSREKKNVKPASLSRFSRGKSGMKRAKNGVGLGTRDDDIESRMGRGRVKGRGKVVKLSKTSRGGRPSSVVRHKRALFASTAADSER